MHHFCAHDIIICLTNDSNQEVENNNQDYPLIQYPENPNYCDHRPSRYWMKLGCFTPKCVNWCIQITNCISVCIHGISWKDVHSIVVIQKHFKTKSLENQRKQHDQTQKENDWSANILKWLKYKLDKHTELFKDSEVKEQFNKCLKDNKKVQQWHET